MKKSKKTDKHNFWFQVLAKAGADNDYRQKLLTDPESVLNEEKKQLTAMGLNMDSGIEQINPEANIEEVVEELGEIPYYRSSDLFKQCFRCAHKKLF